MSNLSEQAVVPSSESYSTLQAGSRWGGNTIVECRVRVPERKGRSAYYRVRCDCGIVRLIRQDKVRKGGDGEKGCFECRKLRTQIPLGTRFGLYVVIENERIVEHGGVTFRACLVRCRCSVERLVAYMNLKSGNSGSCGCSRFDRKDGTEWRTLLCQLKNRARQYRRSCKLNLEQFVFISQLPCAYCKIEPYNQFFRRVTRDVDGERKRVGDENAVLLYSGIDRVNSSKGYFPGNVLPCCQFCNRAKDDWTVAEFIQRLQRFGLCHVFESEIWSQAARLGDELLSLQPRHDNFQP
jgi:hypothetical protein